MKIKRYTAVSMREALAQVRAEQGPDAVILSSRRGDDGIEVIAAVDYDEALFVEANRQRILAAVITPELVPAPEPIRAAVPDPARARASAPEPTVVRAAVSQPAPARVPDPEQAAVRAAVRAAAPGPTPLRAAAPDPAPVRAALPDPAPVRAAIPSPAAAMATAPPTLHARVSARKPVPAPARPDAGYGAMQRELQDLRQLVETGFAGMTWSDKRLREPLKAMVFEELTAMDIA